ncbi:cobalt ECF transporter T component CbiQ [Marichromatium bheemlicum]|uniref:Cobalt ECF transporter T component CbiQ n=1 Tax=Marichromatium bheemlicum TaxID=365339 RepID=A0ABX1IEB1_9GAMM|nr:cobalt ECF transporter T component CbiQ [Marichromatium bheemlicum]NKN34485.1 cobalt ECF transporter T component CbiQ [Marichromatium bheemlicum]
MNDCGAVVCWPDARIRLCCTLAFAVLVVGLERWSALLVALLSGGLLVAWAGVAVRRLLRLLLLFEGGLLLTLALLPFTVPGKVLWQGGAITLTEQGALLTGMIAVRATAVALVSLALLSGLGVSRFAAALRALRVPLALVELVLLSARYLDVLEREQRRLRVAMRARAFRPRTDFHTLSSYGFLIGMILVRALERAERVSAAMRCRGYAGRMPLPELAPLRAADLGFAIGFALLLGALVVLGHG